jgi:hypothetical protein
MLLVVIWRTQSESSGVAVFCRHFRYASLVEVCVNILKIGSLLESPCCRARDGVNPKTKRIVTEPSIWSSCWSTAPCPCILAQLPSTNSNRSTDMYELKLKMIPGVSGLTLSISGRCRCYPVTNFETNTKVFRGFLRPICARAVIYLQFILILITSQFWLQRRCTGFVARAEKCNRATASFCTAATVVTAL